MKRFFLTVFLLVVVLAAFVGGYLVNLLVAPDLPYATPTYALDGNVEVPTFVLPPSEYMSSESENSLKMRAAIPMHLLMPEESIEKSRSRVDTMLAPQVKKTLERFPVNVEESNIAGIPVRIFTPKDKEAEPNRVLINLHGGAFSLCWDSCSMLESAPMASLGGYKVVSVNYRMAPEHKHPAAVQDVETVYRDLLNSYDAKSIGIYGCSAGGVLTAQAAAQIPQAGLAAPGAVGIFGAGAVPMQTGDSAYVSAFIDGSFPPPAKPGTTTKDLTRGYFAGIDMTDPIVSPGRHLDVLSKFPTSLIITGSRAFDMSPAIYTNSQLLKAGVDSRLIVGEGMGHCYIYQSDFPEARDANDAIVGFFKRELK